MFDFELLIRYFKGQAAPEEAMRVDDWTDQEPGNKEIFDELYQAWLEAGDEQYKLNNIQAEWQRFMRNHAPVKDIRVSKNNLSVKLYIAAGLALLLGVCAYFFLFQSREKAVEHIVVHNTSAAANTITLPDGSSVSLYTAGQLSYPRQFPVKERIVNLSGNAFFKVTHNPEQPFIVDLDKGLHVRVLGTSFEIKGQSDSVSVEVVSGKVAFYNATDTIVIPAGETGSFNIAGGRFSSYLSIREGTFNFKDVPMSEVVKQLEVHFRVSIHIQNESLYNCRLSAGLEKESLEDILNVIAATFNIEYHVDHTNIYLSGGTCK